MGGAVSAGTDNNGLVDNLVEANYIKSPDVERVFRAVDRANYYLPEHRDSAYKDVAWKHGHIHMSAPCIYSEVLESLLLEPGLSFLNLGCGTGYLSTMVGLILGPYGINHGIEIYKDVVEYANDRLEHYKQTSPSFDDFDLCEPEFVHGNCLQLPPGQLYNRVYCGAACPQEHENYMKNLLAINGILVMPLNDQLQQIRRTGETTWEVKNVLPVSFANLIVPGKDAETPPVELPSCSFLPLKAACRLSLRRCIRTNIHIDYPDLTKISKAKKKKQQKSVKGRRKINIVPMSMGMMILRQYDSEESDDEGFSRQICLRSSNLPAQEEHSDHSEEEDEIDNNISDLEVNKSVNENSSTNQNENQNGSVISREEMTKTDDIVDEVDYQPSTSSGRDHAWQYPSVRIQKSEPEESSDIEDKPRHNQPRLEVNGGMLQPSINRRMLHNGQLKSRHIKSISTDESDEDNMDFDIVDMLNRSKSASRNPSNPRKIRNSSNTSADTSETSGFGSLGDDPSEVDSCHSSEKASPGSSLGDDGMDCIEEGLETQEENKDNVCTYMKERVNQLPIPATLKSYLLYYRN